MHVITRQFQFDAAHRVLNHESKCKHVHGHRYVAEVSVTPACGGTELDGLDRVIDYGVLKEKIGAWIDSTWDHNLLVNTKDPIWLAYLHQEVVLSHKANVRVGDVFGGQKVYGFEGKNPTAEVIAQELFHVAGGLLVNDYVVVTKVKIWETPNCSAEFSIGGK
jgi:6-pyruvoyltetrahydropterin/6-carboxytetrahydropterin synthase